MSDDDETEAHARASDPSTSHDAAERTRLSRLETKARVCLDESYPRTMSSSELAVIMGVPRDSASPRMRRLQEKGYVECVGRLPSVNPDGKIRTMLHWRAVRKAEIVKTNGKLKQMDLFKEEGDDMGKRSDFKRRPHDDYQTVDSRAVSVLMPYLTGIKTFAEPCCGRGELVKWLEASGLDCVQYCDIIMGTDALTVTDFNGADAIISNPPWTRKILHPLIQHFQNHLPTWLLFDSDWAYNIGSEPYLDKCTDIVAVGRLRWFNDTAGKDNASWYRFWHGHSGGPRFHGRVMKGRGAVGPPPHHDKKHE